MSGWSHPNAARFSRSEERRQKLREHVAQGQSIKGAARIDGVSVRTATRYMVVER